MTMPTPIFPAPKRFSAVSPPEAVAEQGWGLHALKVLICHASANRGRAANYTTLLDHFDVIFEGAKFFSTDGLNCVSFEVSKVGLFV